MTSEHHFKMATTTAISAIHHLKIPVRDLKKTMDFYIQVLGYSHVPEYDHRTPPPENRLFAVILSHPGFPFTLELRHNVAAAEKQVGWNPICYTTKTRKDLDEWAEKLDALQTHRSQVLTGFKGWCLMFEDPDGKKVSLYTEESHEWTTEVSRDAYWVGEL
jgi:catechol-2,3-dioxygenase